MTGALALRPGVRLKRVEQARRSEDDQLVDPPLGFDAPRVYVHCHNQHAQQGERRARNCHQHEHVDQHIDPLSSRIL
jgi:hypothetical protein